MNDSTILKSLSIGAGALLSGMLIVCGEIAAATALAGVLVAYSISEANGTQRAEKAAAKAVEALQEQAAEEWRK